MVTFVSAAYDKLRPFIFPFDAVLEEVPRESKILDAGSAYGSFSIKMAKRDPLSKVVGVEISPERVRSSRESAGSLGNVDFVACDFTEFKGGKFDAVTCLDVMHHVPKASHESFLRKAREVLNDGGVLILVEINRLPTLKYYWNYLHDLVVSRSTQLNYIRPHNMADMIRSSGFRIESVRKASKLMYSRYMIIARAE
jgi:2-polyprenyl-3-methyl-5-hydroxy-6-metoxy-1,4-benzoquinol methylase